MARYSMLFATIAIIRALVTAGLLIWVFVAGRGLARVLGAVGLGLLVLSTGLAWLLQFMVGSGNPMAGALANNLVINVLSVIGIGLLAAGVVVGTRQQGLPQNGPQQNWQGPQQPWER